MKVESTVPQMLFLILLCINCIYAQDYLLVSAPHTKSSRFESEIIKEATDDTDSDAQLASQYAMRVRRRIPPLPRLGRQADLTSRDELAMTKLRRKRSTRDQALASSLHSSDDIKQLAVYDQSDFDQRAAPLPRLGLHRLVEDRSIPLPRIGRIVDDLTPSEYGFEFGDYGDRSSLLPRIGYRSATVRAAPLPRIGRRSDDELGVVPFPRLGR